MDSLPLLTLSQHPRLAPTHLHTLAHLHPPTLTCAVVSKRMAWENIFMVEVVRSCPEMCRFCLASYLTLPFRAAPLEGSLIPSLEVRARACLRTSRRSSSRSPRTCTR